MDVFTKKWNVSDLELFLKENMLMINDFFNYEYTKVIYSKEEIGNFVLNNANVLENLNFSLSYNNAFISVLLEYCSRFSLSSAITRLFSIVDKCSVKIDKRIRATEQYICNIDSNTTLINRFETICEILLEALLDEEDNDIKIITIVLSYYAKIVLDTHSHIQFSQQIQSRINEFKKRKEFSFLDNNFINEAISFDYNQNEETYIQIQKIIDGLLDKTLKEVDILQDFLEETLIEQDTEYSNLLSDIKMSFDLIRRIAKEKNDGSLNVGRGVKIIESEEELFSYMRRFGFMHKCKLESAFDYLPNNFSSKVNIFDWGCGQGIASMVYLERFPIDSVSKIVLIEPSVIAIKRASLHVKKYSSSIEIRTVAKNLDDLTKNDLIIENNGITIHLFSNILDIEDYSQRRLFNLIEETQSEENIFICVSPYINDARNDRVDSIKRYFHKRYNSFELLAEKENSKNKYNAFWNCNNYYRFNRICDINRHKNCGCNNKWTRVLRVFKVKF